ncbi:MAG: stage III sporulation protein AF [Clostridiales bacterium]|jgi:hypothetical protein|nr:stage III sporulation protein AF [Clostridiales bacterium]
MKPYFESVAAVLILQAMARIIVPNKKYQYYIDFVMGVILICLIISPASDFLAKFRERAPAPPPGIVGNYEYISSGGNKIILTAYKDQLENYAESIAAGENQRLLSADFEIGETDSDFGEIKRIRLRTGPAEAPEKPEKPSLIRIEGVKIKPPNESRAGKEHNSAEAERVKNAAAKFYNIAPERINVTVTDEAGAR